MAQVGTGCCYKCGDVADMTLGTFTATGTGDYGGAGLMLAAASGSTVGLKLFTQSMDGVGDLGWQYWSEPDVPSGWGTTGYAYGWGVTVRMSEAGGPAHAVYWAISFFLYRTLITDYVESGECDITYIGVAWSAPGIGDPEIVDPHTCCGGTNHDIVLLVSEDNDAISAVTDVEEIAIDGLCDPICSCGAMPDTVLVETGSISVALGRLNPDCKTEGVVQDPDKCECQWYINADPTPDCPSATYQINLERVGCVWNLVIDELVYDEACELVSWGTSAYAKFGGDTSIGTYARVSGTIGGTSAEVS